MPQQSHLSLLIATADMICIDLSSLPGTMLLDHRTVCG